MSRMTVRASGGTTDSGHPAGGGASSTYVTDIPFVRQFCRELSPTLLRAAAAFGGFRSVEAESFDYCEVGSGTGDTLCTLAAAYPRSRFIGVDINAEHVARARTLADRGGLSNVRFVEQDLEDLGRAGGLPPLDFVGAHGLLSWIVPEKRRALIALSASHLKRGGLFYVSYNALPGWAAVEPLRRLLRDLAGPEGTPIERARRGVAAARDLRDRGARYFQDNLAASEMLDTMTRLGPTYVVHEYFHDHWQPMHVADVAAEMAAFGLQYCASLPLYRNVGRLTLPDFTAELVGGAGDRIAAEALKDYTTNTFFRGDVYVKGDAVPDLDVLAEYLDTTRFSTTSSAEHVRRDIRLPHASLALHGEPFDAIVHLTAQEPRTASDLHRALPMFEAERVREALVDLLVSDQLVPTVTSTLRDANDYNLAVLSEPLSESHQVVLAAPLVGTGIPVTALHAVCLRLLYLVDADQRSAWIDAFVARQPVKLHVSNRAVTDRDEQARVIASEAEKFRVARLPKLHALGVLRPRS